MAHVLMWHEVAPPGSRLDLPATLISERDLPPPLPTRRAKYKQPKKLYFFY